MVDWTPPATEGPRAPFYAWSYVRAVQVARRLGYALAVHGTMRRDLDLVAVPWTARAGRAELVAEAIREEFGGSFSNPRAKDGEPKPHGRRAWAILLGGGLYIDLSVMPRGGRTDGVCA